MSNIVIFLGAAGLTMLVGILTLPGHLAGPIVLATLTVAGLTLAVLIVWDVFRHSYHCQGCTNTRHHPYPY